MESKWIKNEIIPKGKWIRTRSGYIQYRMCEARCWVEALVADDPRELVQVGDLVRSETSHTPKEVLEVHYKDEYELRYGSFIRSLSNAYEDITTIFTMNSNGDYIKQWEKGDE